MMNGIRAGYGMGRPPEPRWMVGMQQTSTNFSEVSVGVGAYQWNDRFGHHRMVLHQKGYGVDLDGDGKFQAGKDGVLAFDINGDGRIDANEIAESQRRLSLMTEAPRILHFADKKGQQRANERRQLMAQYDKNNDGHLDASELHAAGAKMLVDSNKDGVYSADEAQGLSRIETDGGTYRFDSMSLGMRDVFPFWQQRRVGGVSKISPIFDNPWYRP